MRRLRIAKCEACTPGEVLPSKHIMISSQGNGTNPSVLMATRPDISTQDHFKCEILSTLIKISTALSFVPMGLEPALQFLVGEVRRLFNAHMSAIISLDPVLEFKNILAGDPTTERLLLKMGKDLSQCPVYRDELPLIVQENKGKRNRCKGVAAHRDVKSYACLPITTGSRVVGILVITSNQPNAFNHTHLEILLSVAMMAASAIECSHLVHKLEEERDRLQLANEQVKKLNEELASKIKELERAQLQVHRAEKLAVAGRLAAGIAHEVNNPIGVILNRIECVLSEAEEIGIPQNLLKDLGIISRYAEKISKIVEDLSLFSRTTQIESQFEPVEINDVLGDALFLMAQKVKDRKISLIKDFSTEDLIILGDQDKLAQVFINIIDNAVDAVLGEGTIIVTTRQDLHRVDVIVKDSGIGIPKENLEKIFEPFFTTKEVGKGTGLGLSICQAIVREHKGFIDIKSTPEQGTEVCISFPRISHGAVS